MAGINLKNVFVFSLFCEDLPAAAQFYRDVIGLSLLAHHGQRPAFNLGNDTHLVLLKGKSVQDLESGETPFPALALIVENLDRAVAALKDSGVDLAWGIEENITNRWVKFFDPSKNLIELAEFKK